MNNKTIGIIHELSHFVDKFKKVEEDKKKSWEQNDIEKLKSIYCDQIVPYYLSNDSISFDKNKLIVEYLLTKLNNSINFNQMGIISIDNKFVSATQLEKLVMLFQISSIAKMAKNSSKYEMSIILKSNELLETCCNANQLTDNICLHLLIMIKNVYKSMINYEEINTEFLRNTCLLLSKFNLFIKQDNIYFTNKYLKLVDLLTDNEKTVDILSIFMHQLLLKLFKIMDLIESKCDFNLKKSQIHHNISNNLYLKMLILSIKLAFSLIKTKTNLTECQKKFISKLISNDRIDLIYSYGLDDDLIVSFNLNCIIFQSSTVSDEVIEFKSLLNNHLLFFKLVSSISFDYEILIDWLINNETNFLKYLVKYLKFLMNELMSTGSLSELIKVQSNVNGLDLNQVIQLLNKLNSKIKCIKKSFPYNCEPLIKLLDKVYVFYNQAI